MMENKVIKCRNCSGTGRINERWVVRKPIQ